MSAQRQPMGKPFRDRREAGRALGAALDFMRDRDCIVLALARGGVPVGFELARAIDADLEAMLVRKVGAPGNPEYGLGAVAEEGVQVLDDRTIELLGIGDSELRGCIGTAEDELASLISRFRPAGPPRSLKGRAVIIVDDGLATGWTATAAVRAAKARGAEWIAIACPVGSLDVIQRLRGEADEVICLMVPSPLLGVGAWYDDFSQVSDAEVNDLLAESGETAATSGPGQAVQERSKQVNIQTPGGPTLVGDLTVPADAIGLVIFAHGSGSSRLSSRNRHVAQTLRGQGLGTLLFDLLSPDEEGDRSKVFDIPLLATRLAAATDWAAAEPLTADLPIGYFGASTGGGAALVAAAGRDDVAAVVSRGGRPDLADDALPKVPSPVLLIVGEEDREVWAMNQSAADRMTSLTQLVVVPGATHLFEEPGTLDIVAVLAGDWFAEWLSRPAAAPDHGLRTGDPRFVGGTDSPSSRR